MKWRVYKTNKFRVNSWFDGSVNALEGEAVRDCMPSMWGSCNWQPWPAKVGEMPLPHLTLSKSPPPHF